MIKFLDLNSQYLSIKNEIDQALFNVINSSEYIGGKFLNAFESDFSNYIGCKYCVGVANGTDALEIAIESLDLPKGSEIIVPGNSWISSSESVIRLGYKVVFCDINLDDYLMNIDDLKSKITNNTSAIMPVHLYGQICDMDQIIEIANHHNLKVIEDSAQAHGALYKDKKAGIFGNVGCYSFYPGKNLGAYGDAGAIVTNDEKIAEKAKMISNHGQIEKHNHELIGRNSRLDGLQASILSVKLKYLDNWIDKRNEVASIYFAKLKENKKIQLPIINSYSKHAFHLFVIRYEYRDKLMNHLKKNDIEVAIHYPNALSDLNIHKHFVHNAENATKASSEILSLPIGEHLSNNQVIEVCSRVNEFTG